MLLLTGATGELGKALLPRLLADGRPVRCLVRDPRRLGAQRVRVQIALGDLTDPPSFRNAMRGVDTVVHLAAAIRDQPEGSIEELNGIASWRMVQAARQAGVQRFVFFSALGASTHSRGRFFRAKALAEQAVNESGLHSIVFAPSLVYAPRDRWLTLLERLSLTGVTPISGRGHAIFQPIWAEDVADCVLAALRRDDTETFGAATGNGGGVGVDTGTSMGTRTSAGTGTDTGTGTGTGEASEAGADLGGAPTPGDSARGNGARGGTRGRRYELAGPQTLTHEEIVRAVLRSLGRREALVHVPVPVLSRALPLLERIGAAGGVLPTWDEAELMEVPMISARGAADVEALGVRPNRIGSVLGVA